MSDLTTGALIAGVSGIAGTVLGVTIAGFHANRLISRQEHFLREERKASEEERQRTRELEGRLPRARLEEAPERSDQSPRDAGP